MRGKTFKVAMVFKVFNDNLEERCTLSVVLCTPSVVLCALYSVSCTL